MMTKDIKNCTESIKNRMNTVWLDNLEAILKAHDGSEYIRPTFEKKDIEGIENDVVVFHDSVSKKFKKIFDQLDRDLAKAISKTPKLRAVGWKVEDKSLIDVSLTSNTDTDYSED